MRDGVNPLLRVFDDTLPEPTMLYSKDFKNLRVFFTIIPDNKTVMVCTGKKDVEKQLIYEGDILGYSGNEPCFVKYNADECSFVTVPISRHNSKYYFYNLMSAHTPECRILGNIYQHKHLLKIHGTTKIPQL